MNKLGLPRQKMALRDAAQYLYGSLHAPKWGGYRWRMLRLAFDFAGADFEQVLNYLGAVVVHNAPYYARGVNDAQWSRYDAFDPQLMVDRGATEIHAVDMHYRRGARQPTRRVEPFVEKRHVVALAKNIPDEKIWTAW